MTTRAAYAFQLSFFFIRKKALLSRSHRCFYSQLENIINIGREEKRARHKRAESSPDNGAKNQFRGMFSRSSVPQSN